MTMGDKEDAFRGSRDWIGSVEVGLCIDYFYDVSAVWLFKAGNFSVWLMISPSFLSRFSGFSLFRYLPLLYQIMEKPPKHQRRLGLDDDMI